LKRIQVVYRNYIPLNSPYSSFWNNPPENVKFLIPKPIGIMKHFFPIYRSLGRYTLIQKLVRLISDSIFSKPPAPNDVDAFFYVGLTPKEIPQKPFFIDLEHINALVDFLGPEEFARRKQNLLELFCHPLCHGIVPISQAAANTVKIAFDADFHKFSHKIKVIYPSLPLYIDKYKGQVSTLKISNKSPDTLHFLFVGKESLRKGLPQLLDAFAVLSNEFPNVFLNVVSDTPRELKEKFERSGRIRFYEPRFSTDEIVTQFFMPSDVFVLPTLEDSFGMVYLEALSSGLAVVLTKQFATPEIVQDKTNGLFLDLPKFALDSGAFLPPKKSNEYRVSSEFHEKMVSELVKCMKYFVTDRSFLTQAKQSATFEFKAQGKFSNEYRNHLLLDLFKNI